MDCNEREELVRKTVSWLLQADRSVKSVGGYGVDVILRGISDDLLYTMVANDLHITSKVSQ